METVVAGGRMRLRHSSCCAEPAKLFQNDCYGDLCFGVFALSVEMNSNARKDELHRASAL